MQHPAEVIVPVQRSFRLSKPLAFAIAGGLAVLGLFWWQFPRIRVLARSRLAGLGYVITQVGTKVPLPQASAPVAEGTPAPSPAISLNLAYTELSLQVAQQSAQIQTYRGQVQELRQELKDAVQEVLKNNDILLAQQKEWQRLVQQSVGSAVGTGSGASSPAAPATGLVNLNAATAAELDELPGIGPTTAAAIVAYRAANGPFASVDALESVKGIGPALMATLRPLVTV